MQERYMRLAYIQPEPNIKPYNTHNNFSISFQHVFTIFQTLAVNEMSLFSKYAVTCCIIVSLLEIGSLSSGAFAQKLPQNILRHFHYRSIGPTRQGGRIADFAAPRQQPHTFYVAASNGGLWKTENNGTTFIPVFDGQNVLSIGGVAVAPSDPDIVWVGTGESHDGGLYWGDGIYKSTDGGKSWKNMGLTESHHISRIVIHPADPDVVYVSVHGKLYSESSERGLYKTNDGGRSWDKVLEVFDHGRYIGVIDLVIDPKDPETLYAAAWNKVRKPWTAWDFNEFTEGGGLYKTSNGGDSWTRLTNGLPDRSGRIGLDVYHRDPQIVYAAIDEGRTTSERFTNTWIYKSDNGGDSWRRLNPENEGLTGGSYFGQIRVDPNDPDHVILLSTGTLQTLDGGKTWERAFEYGGDNHALRIDPDDSRRMLLGYDYGFAMSFDGGKNWLHPDNLPLAQIYEIDYDMDYPYNVYAGIYDFGSWKGPNTKKGRFPVRLEDWEHIGGGDGFYNKADRVNGRWVYSSSQNGSLTRVDRKTGTRKRIRFRSDPGLRFSFNAPHLISPHNGNVIYQAANVVLRSSFQGENWEIISPDLTTNDPQYKDIGPIPYCTITTLDESPVRQGVIWAGTDDGNVQLTVDGGEIWTKLNDRITGNPGYWVKRVSASKHYAGKAYVVYTGYYHDDFRPFVFKTEDFGKTWTSISGDLPDDEPVNVVREDHKNPDLLFAGTEKAVYVSVNGGANWTRMKNNMPSVGIQDLAVHSRENDLIVGTHGRGFYITDISPLQELTPEVREGAVHLFSIEPKVQWVIPHETTNGNQNFEGENEPHGVVINYYLKEPVRNGVSVSIYRGAVLMNELSGPGVAGLNSVEWPMTRIWDRTEEEIVRWEEREIRLANSEHWYDKYDVADWYGEQDEEVAKNGLSLRTRIHHPPGETERDYKYTRVQPGEYTVVLKAGPEEQSARALILKDHWYDK